MQVDKPSKDSAIPIWKLDKTGVKRPVTNQDLSFWNQFTRDYFDKISNVVQSQKNFHFDDMEVGFTNVLYYYLKGLNE